MKRLVCELCGSQELIKEDGCYVCQSCGSKFSLEEAKKMLVEVDGVVEVKGKVSIDKSPELDNYKMLMEEAYKADKSKETYEYAEKILQIDNSNSRAWVLKGISAGWLSTLNGIRIKEALLCFRSGIKCVEPSEKEEYIKFFKEKFEHMGQCVCTWVGKQYYDYPKDKGRANSTISAYLSFMESIKEFNKDFEPPFDESKIVEWFFNNLKITCQNAMDYSNKEFGITPHDDYKRSNHYNYENYINTCINNMLIFKSMIDIVETKEQLEFIKKQIRETTKLLVESYSTTRSSYGYGYIKDRSLTEEAKKINNDNCAEWCGLIDKRLNAIFELERKQEEERRAKEEAERLAKEEAQRKSNEAYWNAHAELKTKLLNDKRIAEETIKVIESKIEECNERIDKIKNTKFDSSKIQGEIDSKKTYLSELHTQLSKLGIFKIKEKKEVNANIEQCRVEISNLEKELKSQIDTFEKQKNSDIQPIREEIGKNQDLISEQQGIIEKIDEELNRNY